MKIPAVGDETPMRGFCSRARRSLESNDRHPEAALELMAAQTQRENTFSQLASIEEPEASTGFGRSTM
jgi:hypothetical protein